MAPILSPLHSSEIKNKFGKHFEDLVDYLLTGVSERSKAAWRQSLIHKIPKIPENVDHESLFQYFDIRKIVHVKKVVSNAKMGQIEISNGVGLSGRVIKIPSERHILKVKENVQGTD